MVISISDRMKNRFKNQFVKDELNFVKMLKDCFGHVERDVSNKKYTFTDSNISWFCHKNKAQKCYHTSKSFSNKEKQIYGKATAAEKTDPDTTKDEMIREHK